MNQYMNGWIDTKLMVFEHYKSKLSNDLKTEEDEYKRNEIRNELAWINKRIQETQCIH